MPAAVSTPGIDRTRSVSADQNRSASARTPVLARRQGDLGREHAVGIEFRIHALKLPEASDQEAGDDQDHERHRHLSDDEHVARTCAASAARSLSERRQGGRHAALRRMQRGRQPEDEAGGEREREREEQRGLVEGELGEPRHDARTDGAYALHEVIGERRDRRSRLPGRARGSR